MKLRSLVILLFAVSLHAAPMVRVAAIKDSSTITIERDGVRSDVRLAGIEITDARNAMAFLTWSVNGSWVLIDDGQVYRSPDGMHVNAELVRKGYARFTGPSAPPPRANVVYLGEVDPGPRPQARAQTRAPERRARSARPSPVRRPASPPRRGRAQRR